MIYFCFDIRLAEVSAYSLVRLMSSKVFGKLAVIFLVGNQFSKLCRFRYPRKPSRQRSLSFSSTHISGFADFSNGYIREYSVPVLIFIFDCNNNLIQLVLELGRSQLFIVYRFNRLCSSFFNSIQYFQIRFCWSFVLS